MINDFKDLERLLKLCRKQGITDIELGQIKLKFGDLPQEYKSNHPELDHVGPYKNFPQGDLTPEQLMFYSAGGVPENDPALQGGNN